MQRKSKKPESRGGYEYWEKHINDWKVSGQTQAEYCRQNGLKPWNFSYWKKRLEEVEYEEMELVEVPVASPERPQQRRKPDPSLIEVRLDESGQFTIKVSPEYYRQLLGLEDDNGISER